MTDTNAGVANQIELVVKIIERLLAKKALYKGYLMGVENVFLTDDERSDLDKSTSLIDQIASFLKNQSNIITDLTDLKEFLEYLYNHALDANQQDGRHRRILSLLDDLKKTNNLITNMKFEGMLERGDFIALNEKVKAVYERSDSDFQIKILNTKINEESIRLNDLSKKHLEVIEYQSEAERIISDLKSKNKGINTLIDETSNAQEKILYETIYNSEIKIANDYRNSAFIIFLIIGVLVLSSFIFSSIQNLFFLFDKKGYFEVPLDLSYVVRLIALFSLSAPAWYLTMESSKHRKVAYKAKILGTELEALPYYMNQLSNEQRIDMRIQMVSKFFGQSLYNDEDKVNKSDDSVGAKTQLELTTAILKLTEAVKSKV